jgi:hypothetical protein
MSTFSIDGTPLLHLHSQSSLAAQLFIFDIVRAYACSPSLPWEAEADWANDKVKDDWVAGGPPPDTIFQSLYSSPTDVNCSDR